MTSPRSPLSAAKRLGATLCAASVASLLVLTGCSQNPFTLQQNQAAQQAQAALQQRTQELQSRASSLDTENQEIQTMLAQSRQQTKLVEDQVAILRDQLSSAGTQLAQLKSDKELTERQADALAASAKRRTGAIITANSSLRKNMPALNLPGIDIREDGDVVRIELPAQRLFNVGSTTLQPAAALFIDNATMEISRAYPDQMIGVEGHTDKDPRGPGADVNNQQLATARAMAVYQHIVSRGHLRTDQLFTVGHGGNHPLVSNATLSGRGRNNRVEIVVYPDKFVQQ